MSLTDFFSWLYRFLPSYRRTVVPSYRRTVLQGEHESKAVSDLTHHAAPDLPDLLREKVPVNGDDLGDIRD